MKMKANESMNEKNVKVTYTNPLGMQITVKKHMTVSELKEELHEGKISLNKISA